MPRTENIILQELLKLRAYDSRSVFLNIIRVMCMCWGFVELKVFGKCFILKKQKKLSIYSLSQGQRFTIWQKMKFHYTNSVSPVVKISLFFTTIIDSLIFYVIIPVYGITKRWEYEFSALILANYLSFSIILSIPRFVCRAEYFLFPNQ